MGVDGPESALTSVLAAHGWCWTCRESEESHTDRVGSRQRRAETGCYRRVPPTGQARGWSGVTEIIEFNVGVSRVHVCRLGQTYIFPNIFPNIPCLPGKKNLRKYPLSGDWRAPHRPLWRPLAPLGTPSVPPSPSWCPARKSFLPPILIYDISKPRAPAKRPLRWTPQLSPYPPRDPSHGPLPTEEKKKTQAGARGGLGGAMCL